jgi:hypothetical protein
MDVLPKRQRIFAQGNAWLNIIKRKKDWQGKGMEKEPKKFYCGTKEICAFKEAYINNRCFAVYQIRQSCPNILRVDNKTQRQGSTEEAVLTK